MAGIPSFKEGGRQKEVVTSIGVEGQILINNKSSALAFTTLLQAQVVSLQLTYLKVGGAVEEEGWKELAKAMQGRAGQGTEVSISKEALAAASREDIEAVGKFRDLEVFNKNDKLPVDTDDWDQTWARLKLIAEMTEDEFTAQCDEEERRRWEEDGIYTSSDEEEYEDYDSWGGDSMEELEGEEEDDNEGGGEDD